MIRLAILSDVQVTLRYLVGKSLRKVIQIEVEITDSKTVASAVEAVEKGSGMLGTWLLALVFPEQTTRMLTAILTSDGIPGTSTFVIHTL